MTDYIERRALIDNLEQMKKFQIDFEDILEIIDNFDAADVLPCRWFNQMNGECPPRGKLIVAYSPGWNTAVIFTLREDNVLTTDGHDAFEARYWFPLPDFPGFGADMREGTQ